MVIAAIDEAGSMRPDEMICFLQPAKVCSFEIDLDRNEIINALLIHRYGVRRLSPNVCVGGRNVRPS